MKLKHIYNIMITINKLTKKYGKKIALHDISLTIKHGDFFSLLGKNGAGKSTLIGILASLIKKDYGDINILNYNLDRDNAYIKQLIGLVPQEYNFNQFETVLEIILNQAGYYGISRKESFLKAKMLLKLLDLWESKDTISMKLSGGMKRRLMLIRSLIHDPKILMLDEPTAGVDIITRHIIWNLLTDINKSGTTIILTTHYFEEIEKLCTNVAIIQNGIITLESNIRTLINDIEIQTYLIETPSANLLLNIKNNNFKIIEKSHNLFEISFSKNIPLNNLLQLLLENNIPIYDIKNQKNNLENLFMTLIK